MYKAYFYFTRRGDYPVKDFINDLDKKARAKIWRYIDLLKQHGPYLIRPYADVVRDKIRELRIRLKDGNVRILYFFFEGRNVIFLHALKKKTWEIPEKDFKQAKERMDDFIVRYQQKEFTLL